MMQTTEEVKKPLKFQRLIDRKRELSMLWRENIDNDDYGDECYTLDHFFAGGAENYKKISKFCQDNHIRRIVDIGCAYGHQSEIFLQDGIDYVGVSDHGKSKFWNEENFTFLSARYPCVIPAQPGDLGVSILCLTWNCYLIEGEKTLREQCEALVRDFEHCLLYMSLDKLDTVSQYFKKTTRLEGNFVYLSNK